MIKHNGSKIKKIKHNGSPIKRVIHNGNIIYRNRMANGIFIQTKDGSLYTKSEWEALPNKPLKSGVYIQTVDGKVYTEDQYKALVPNGVYIQTVDGKLYTKSEWEVHKPADGIYIESVDGNLYTRSQWNTLTDKPQVNGVTVVNGSHIFTVGLQDSTSQLTWQAIPYAINYITYKSNENEARADFKGFENSSFINERGSSCEANYYCKTFQFQNGQYGYLGSMGEMAAMLQNKGEINECLSIIGGTLLDSYVYWTSTANSLYASWYINVYSGAVGTMDNDVSYYVRPLTPTKKYTPKGIAVVTDETRYVVGLTRNPTNLKWQNSTGNISGLSDISSIDLAKADFNGRSNSNIIATASNGGANAPVNEYCQNFTFPDGSKGYLPAAGELYIVYQNLTSINELLTLVGGMDIAQQLSYWSSTERSAGNAWSLEFKDGSVTNAIKTGARYIHPFTTLSFEDITLKPNAIVVVDSKTSFKIALEDATTLLAWQTTVGDIEGLPYVDADSVESDFNGKIYSDIIKSSQNGGSNCPANDYCVNYSFNDGSKGFLPSAGQLWLATNNKDSINRILDSIGTKILDGTYNSYWSSSLFAADDAWYAYFRNSGSVVHAGFAKTTAMSIRPFGTFENGDPNLTPNGIVVVDDNYAFVVALEDAPSTLVWITPSDDIVGVPNITSVEQAKLDFNGKLNSDAIQDAPNGGSNCPANSYCYEYTFINGNKGYLPACGQLYAVYQNKSVVNELLELVGKTLTNNIYWSSSEYNTSYAWVVKFSDGNTYYNGKPDSLYVRPFGAFDAEA